MHVFFLCILPRSAPKTQATFSLSLCHSSSEHSSPLGAALFSYHFPEVFIVGLSELIAMAYHIEDTE